MGSTLPNREYMHAAAVVRQRDNDLPPQTAVHDRLPGHTIFAALDKAGVSNRYFFNDVPVSALWGADRLAQLRLGRRVLRALRERHAAARLATSTRTSPAASARARARRGDEHPHGDVRAGQAFMADVVHAFMESPQFKRGALFIVYDEWGGFFDHVAPAARARRAQRPATSTRTTG